MRAVQFSEYGPPGVIHVADVEEPHAGPGTVRITVRATGLSTGETRIRSGALRDLVPVDFPFRTGFDAAGVVDEVGAGVTGVRAGDEVFGMVSPALRGANAEHAVLIGWAPKPADWSWAQAGGAAGSIETSVRVLDLLGVDATHTVLINGASGGVGSVAVQLAVARGATVIGTASAHNHDYVRSLGGQLTAYGKVVSAVFDCVGGTLPELIALAGSPDRVVTIADLDAAAHGVRMSRGPLALDSLAVAAKVPLRIRVAAAFPLAGAAAAHELSETRHGGGKIVLVP
ncbi:NADP-dependent oxidoreductase [Actinoplanes sp. NPDC051494]|uniref:NADP-dependent oxidoreductase n=1 Tax=Actinoplanes sp. NPDC051494 TaxID=3363907 RepID=UPI00379D2455